jgi:phthalate 4,5-dioxygenase oxygenase subunit
VLEWGKDVDRHFNSVRTAGNLYQQDRAAMKAGNFTGIKGIPNQDIAMWESMGPISDRGQERVGVSDIAVNAFRRLMVEAASAVRDGKPAIGTTEPRVSHASISSFEGVVPKSTDWRNPCAGSGEHSPPAS